jgi:hypothetical protein
MAEIIPLKGPCGACAVLAPASPFDGVRRWLAGWWPRAGRLGNADELPEHMRRDMGLAPVAAEPSRHYFDYLTSNRP